MQARKCAANSIFFMLVEYDSNQLAKICKNEKQLVRKLGAQSAKQFIRRVAQMKAFDTLGLYLQYGIGHPERLSGWHRMPACSVRLNGNQRIIFLPDISDCGGDINNCNQVVIEGVVNYHGSSSTDWYIP